MTLGFDVLWMLLGLALLTAGAEVLVAGASRVARGLGIPALVVGLTVVAFGTSAPELTVSVLAALEGRPELALGNVLGSNICNTLLILGLCATILPLAVSALLLRVDIPVMVALSVLVAGLSADELLTRVEGGLLLALLVLYLVALLRRSGGPEVGDGEEGGDPSLGRDLGKVAVGLLLLVLGSRAFVGAAVGLARAAGLSELVIGLTVVAVGTSLPEIATSVLAAWRGEGDLAVGNVVGSNVFNLLAVLGVTLVLSPAGVPVASGVLRFDLPVLVATAVVTLPIAFTGSRIERWEGALLLGGYVAYTAYLLLVATDHDALATYSHAMVGFVLPLAGITLLALSTRDHRRARARPPEEGPA